MSQWYCAVSGTRYGPVSQDQVLCWIAEGRVRPDDLVWHAGMTEWLPASAIPGLFPAGYGPMSPPELGSVPRPAGGTGGQASNAKLMTEARSLLAGRWGLPIGFCVLFTLLSMVPRMLGGLGTIIGLIVDGPLALGMAIFFLTFTRGGTGEVGMLFAGFKNFAHALVAHLLINLFVFLWMLLLIIPVILAVMAFPRTSYLIVPWLLPLIIPAIIARLAYSQTMYLLADDPQLDGLAAIRKSKAMMQGYKWKLFCLGCRFIGWHLLCILTLLIGYLWLIPYISASNARFHDDLLPPAAGAEDAHTHQPAAW